ncbi:hypothetical protein GCM10027425_30720 [Alteromonas gracilis]
MIWVVGVLVILVIGAAAVAAAGHGEGLSDAPPDRPDVALPDDGPLHGEDLREVRFSTAVRGYRMDEVDALLARLAEQLDGGPGTDPRAAHDDPPATPEPRDTPEREG